MAQVARSSATAFGRAPLFAILFVCAAVNGFFGTMAAAVGDSPWLAAFVAVFSISAIIWIALLAILQLAHDAPAATLRKLDVAVLGIGFACCFLPTGWEARIALLAAAIYLWRTSNQRTPERRIAIIAASLSAPLIWGRLAVHFFAPELLGADAAMVGLLTGHQVQGNVVAFSPSALAESGRQMVIMSGCSSFKNLSLAVVLLALVTQLLDLPLGRRSALLGLAIGATAVLVNVARLAAIAMFPANFDWLHTGTGAIVFGYATLIGMGAVAYAGSSMMLRRARA